MSYFKKYEILEENYPLILSKLSESIVKEKIAHLFPHFSSDELNCDKFKKALEIIEFKTIELWNNNDLEFIEYCSNYLDLALLLNTPKESYAKIYWILKLIAFGYLGEDWQKVRKFLIEEEKKLVIKNFSNLWNLRLLEGIYNAVFYLVKKVDFSDLEKSINQITQLRIDQKEYENQFLNSFTDESEKKANATDLASLYHLAKSIELLSTFQNTGQPNDIKEHIDFHIDNAQRYCEYASNIELNLLLQYLRPALHKMISNSIWTVARGQNSRVSKFKDAITKAQNPIFELLYPQKKTIVESDIFTKKAVVVSLPTSSGKTLVAEFRMLHALNQFTNGWVAYLVPTRALVNQIHIRLQRDLSIGELSLKIEKMSGALEIDAFEEDLINNSDFDVLVTTYEKFSLFVRQDIEQKLNKKLALVVVDEAHNLETDGRGLGLELMLSNLKNKDTNFLLLTPEIPAKDAREIAQWLGDDNSNSINIELHWQPNERMIGEIYAEGEKRTRNIETYFFPRITDKSTLSINEKLLIKKYDNDCPFSFSDLNTKGKLALLVAREHNANEGILVMVGSPNETVNIAIELSKLIPNEFEAIEDIIKNEINLVKKFVAAEMGNSFPLVELLEKQIGIHSAALPDEVRFLIEELMEMGALKYLVCTTTIAQGINFPISAIFMSTYKYSSSKGTYNMPTKDFWNLVGRAGRMGQKSIGIVGVVVNNDEDRKKLAKYLKQSGEDLISILQKTIDDYIEYLDKNPNKQFDFYSLMVYNPEWSNFLQYISHLYNQTKNLDEVLKNIELSLRKTYGYKKLSQTNQRILSDKVKEYTVKLSKNPGLAALSDSTGFSTLTISNSIQELKNEQIDRNSFSSSIFSTQTGTLQKLVGIMLKAPEIRKQIENIKKNEVVKDRKVFAEIIADWVSGKNLDYIADKYFDKNITECTRSIYQNIVNSATWGLAVLQNISIKPSEMEKMSSDELRKIKNLPSMIYYGVDTEAAVSLRKNNVPRSIVNNLGKQLELDFGNDALKKKPKEIELWLKEKANWQIAIDNKNITGEEYRKIWSKLNGIR